MLKMYFKLEDGQPIPVPMLHVVFTEQSTADLLTLEQAAERCVIPADTLKRMWLTMWRWVYPNVDPEALDAVPPPAHRVPEWQEECDWLLNDWTHKGRMLRALVAAMADDIYDAFHASCAALWWCMRHPDAWENAKEEFVDIHRILERLPGVPAPAAVREKQQRR